MFFAYQSLLIKPIFSVLAHAEKQFFSKLVFQCLSSDNINNCLSCNITAKITYHIHLLHIRKKRNNKRSTMCGSGMKYLISKAVPGGQKGLRIGGPDTCRPIGSQYVPCAAIKRIQRICKHEKRRDLQIQAEIQRIPLIQEIQETVVHP